MMAVHPDKTAIRAVDACGGTYTLEQTKSGYAAGHTDALCDAMKAVVEADSLTADLLAGLQWAMRQIDESYIETLADKAKYDAANAAIAKATGEASS